jgi:hypothetical protein
MRKVLSIAVSLAAAVALSVPASANGAQTMTVTFKNQSATFPVPATPCNPPAVVTLSNGNGVFHSTVNAAGDFWVTGTMEADVDFATATALYTGHVASWFGESSNNMNDVQHAVFNVQLSNPSATPRTLDIHAVFHLSVSATGQLNMQPTSFTC